MWFWATHYLLDLLVGTSAAPDRIFLSGFPLMNRNDCYAVYFCHVFLSPMYLIKQISVFVRLVWVRDFLCWESQLWYPVYLVLHAGIPAMFDNFHWWRFVVVGLDEWSLDELWLVVLFTKHATGLVSRYQFRSVITMWLTPIPNAVFHYKSVVFYQNF